MNPVLLGSIAALCWGTLDFLAGGISRKLGPIRVTAVLTLSGLILITAWLAFAGEFPSLARSDLWIPAISGACFALATAFLFAAIASGPVSLAVPITMAYPATSVALAAALGSVPSLIQVLCILIILVGAFFVSRGEDASEGEPVDSRRRRKTIICALLAHATFVIAILAGQKAAPLFGEIESVWLSRIAGTAVMLPLLFLPTKEERPRMADMPLLALFGFLDVLGISLVIAAGKADQPELATACATASGTITVVLARIFLREHVAPVRWLGIALTFAGVAGLSLLK
ncbi:MAG: GRP family sugar transporter [Parvibaculaceae bacterium]